MSEGRAIALAVVVTLVMVVAGAILLGSEGPAEASTLSRAPGGWLAARRYLEEMGTPVALIDHGLDEPIGDGVLVLTFPWQRAAMDDVATALIRHLQQGGGVVLAYTDRFDPVQSEIVKAIGLGWEDRRPRPPLWPRPWRAYAAEEWSLAGGGAEAVRETRITALRRVPRPPPTAEVLLRDAQGGAVAFRFPRGQGRVVVIPADVLSNARLGLSGNADFLEALRQDLHGSWRFDEFHHGLRAAAGPAETGPQRVLLLYVLQVAFVYLLCALAVARRFGPAWRDPPAASGSAATFLVGLGALHHRLGHHREAAQLLVARAQELDPRVRVPSMSVEDAKGLVRLARRIGASQTGRGHGE